MRTVGVLEARTHFSNLLAAVERGEELEITRHGKVIAHLGPPVVQTEKAKPSRVEVAERFRALRERISREHPETDNLTWEDLKEMARS